VCVHPIIHFGQERILEIHHSPTRLRARPNRLLSLAGVDVAMGCTGETTSGSQASEESARPSVIAKEHIVMSRRLISPRRLRDHLWRSRGGDTGGWQSATGGRQARLYPGGRRARGVTDPWIGGHAPGVPSADSRLGNQIYRDRA
jgi:hypothetical protein